MRTQLAMALYYMSIVPGMHVFLYEQAQVLLVYFIMSVSVICILYIACCTGLCVYTVCMSGYVCILLASVIQQLSRLAC